MHKRKLPPPKSYLSRTKREKKKNFLPFYSATLSTLLGHKWISPPVTNPPRSNWRSYNQVVQTWRRSHSWVC
ncbi:hypothetical protein ES332_A12G224500v1 [Gossypium tomentosum]|uniref:Uncharacterized protein n=1 Tax=Gossypium tomentosum TaxID=34277 RepID=A0A5D2N103_GOSTO|nr:hypothetical protein ES332_A12G224500v1 [Gossypium tomentosum]